MASPGSGSPLPVPCGHTTTQLKLQGPKTVIRDVVLAVFGSLFRRIHTGLKSAGKHASIGLLNLFVCMNSRAAASGAGFPHPPGPQAAAHCVHPSHTCPLIGEAHGRARAQARH
jgi:hypothetical protein